MIKNRSISDFSTVIPITIMLQKLFGIILIKTSFAYEFIVKSLKMTKISLLFFLMTLGIPAIAQPPKRIITLSGALTETVDALGSGAKIAAVDVTSTYPAYINRLPRVSQTRSVSAESLLSFSPDLILAPEGAINKATEFQLKSAGINVITIVQEYSAKGATKFIRQVSSAIGAQTKGEELAAQTEQNLNKALDMVKKNPKKPKVLFIYARGTGVMMVAGKDTSMDAIIRLAGGRNAAQGLSKFKPYTTEALINANPDLILLFDFGYKSLGGMNSILKMPGVGLTNAGKNKRIVEMDGELLVNFSSRLAQAITQLNSKW
jgi:iron complex transport system substrate-binding protein